MITVDDADELERKEWEDEDRRESILDNIRRVKTESNQQSSFLAAYLDNDNENEYQSSPSISSQQIREPYDSIAASIKRSDSQQSKMSIDKYQQEPPRSEKNHQRQREIKAEPSTSRQAEARIAQSYQSDQSDQANTTISVRVKKEKTSGYETDDLVEETDPLTYYSRIEAKLVYSLDNKVPLSEKFSSIVSTEFDNIELSEKHLEMYIDLVDVNDEEETNKDEVRVKSEPV